MTCNLWHAVCLCMPVNPVCCLFLLSTVSYPQWPNFSQGWQKERGFRDTEFIWSSWKIRWLIKKILLPCGNINMQIQLILDIRESPWELSPEAQTHTKLLLTGTVLLLPVFTSWSPAWGFWGLWEQGRKRKVGFSVKLKAWFTSVSFKIVASFENIVTILHRTNFG